MYPLTAKVALSDPEAEDETTFVHVTGRCTSHGHSGFFDPIAGYGEPPCDSEYEDSEWQFEDPTSPGKWTKMPDGMVSRLMADSGNMDLLNEAFDEEEADHDLAVREALADFQHGGDD